MVVMMPDCAGCCSCGHEDPVYQIPDRDRARSSYEGGSQTRI